MLVKPVPYGIPWRECEPRATYTPKSRIFAELSMSKCKPQNSHKPKSSSFRNLSSNEVRYKFREREKVKITFPTKSDANPTFDRDLVEVERYILRYARSASSKSATCVYGRRLRYFLKITSKTFHFKAIALKSAKVLLVLFFQEKYTPVSPRGERLP